ncbi:MAG TPA: PAS domain S-box protein [Solirubrobacteraceae bacterium]|nr:PAS domain S-box protein [Solirubrobacteraceae bacterium]
MRRGWSARPWSWRACGPTARSSPSSSRSARGTKAARSASAPWCATPPTGSAPRWALREAEERFAGAFEGAAVGMVLATPDGIVLRANRALCELTGLEEDQLAGRRLDEFVHPDERTADITAIRAMLAGRTERLTTERRMLGAGGRTRIARVNLSLIRETDGTPLHFVGQVEDVNCYVVKPLDLDDFTALVQAINRFWFEVARLPPR